jgi:hypothetical protein
LTGSPARPHTPGTTGIGAAFGAIENVMRTMALELGPAGVRSVCLRTAANPDTRTIQETTEVIAEMMQITSDQAMANLAEGTMLKISPHTADTARATVFLASDRAHMMTGTVLNASAGAVTDWKTTPMGNSISATESQSFDHRPHIARFDVYPSSALAMPTRQRRNQMAKFVFSYRTPNDYVGFLPETVSNWSSWFETLGDHLVDRGLPVREVGLVGEFGNHQRFGGFSVVNAEDLESALSLADGCPGLEDGFGVEVGALIDPDSEA